MSIHHPHAIPLEPVNGLDLRWGSHPLTSSARRRVVNDYDGWMPTIMRTDEFLAGVAEIRCLIVHLGQIVALGDIAAGRGDPAIGLALSRTDRGALP